MLRRFSLLAALVAALGLVVACDSDSPTEPSSKLQSTFTGTFTPAVLDEDGTIEQECVIELVATASGGKPFPAPADAYRYDWQMAWLRQAAVVTGYPASSAVVLVMPPEFGRGALFRMRLEVEDQEGERSSASADRRFDCLAEQGFTFQGL